MRHSASLTWVLALVLLCGCGRDPTPQQLDAQLDQAIGSLTQYNFRDAYDEFAAPRALCQIGSPQWQQATFGMAVSGMQIVPVEQEQVDEAAQLLEELVRTSPKSKFTPRALMHLGRIREARDFKDDPIDLPGARAYYQQVLDKYPNQPIADEAAARVAGTYIQQYAQPDSVRQGITFLQQYLAANPDNSLASVMWEYMGDSAFNLLQDDALALDCWLKADALGLTNTIKSGELYWRMAFVAQHSLNRLDVAVRCYQKIITEAPRSGRAYEAQKTLEDLRRAHPQMRIEVPAYKLIAAGTGESEEVEAP